MMAATGSKEKPVIVFVHGAWHYPLLYHGLIDPLRAQGYTLVTPHNATTGMDDTIAGKSCKDDVKQIQDAMLPYLDGGKEAILVCHSYGGLPATASIQGQTVEERASRGLKGGVRGIVYIAAFAAPRRGDSVWSLQNNSWPEWHRAEGPCMVLNPTSEVAFYNDIPQATRDELLPKLLPFQSVASLATGAYFVAQELSIPKTYIVCTEDQAIPTFAQQAMAAAAAAKVVELKCGHSPFLKAEESQEIVKLVAEMASS